MFTILSLNVNDFGGISHHLQEYKKLNSQGKEVTDWKTWKELVDKEPSLLAILSYIKRISPSIIILQEFEVNNSDESIEFVEQLSKHGYKRISNIPHYKASVTVVFTKLEFVPMENPNTLDGRSFAFRIEDIIIYGTHTPPKIYETYIPPKSKDRISVFWDEIDNFYKQHHEEKVIMIGDFNTINPKNMRRYKQLLDVGGIDVWLEKGYADNVPTCGDIRMDMAIVSPALLPFVSDITICPSLLNKGVTDHAALIVDIEMNAQ